MSRFERIFPEDKISKLERVELTLNHKTVDRVALHDQLSYSPSVVADYTGKIISGFSYSAEDIGVAIKKSLDMCFPPVVPLGVDTVTTEDGFIDRNDNWTSWHVSRPFVDEHGAAEWMKTLIARTAVTTESLEPDRLRSEYRIDFERIQRMVGESVICNYSGTGFSMVFDRMGLEIFSYFTHVYPELFGEFMEASAEYEVRVATAVADRALSPVILIPEDFATKQGPIFSPEFLARYHYPYVRRLTSAWRDAGITVLYHSDGNFRKAIPDLIDCGVDGFYCLEPNCGMDIVELKNRWPEFVWAGGVDGVDLMERGRPKDVYNEVIRHIRETDAVETGGMFVASSSEINPPIPSENYRAMVNAVGDTAGNGDSGLSDDTAPE